VGEGSEDSEDSEIMGFGGNARRSGWRIIIPFAKVQSLIISRLVFSGADIVLVVFVVVIVEVNVRVDPLVVIAVI
jgi:hypothetical protein